MPPTTKPDRLAAFNDAYRLWEYRHSDREPVSYRDAFAGGWDAAETHYNPMFNVLLQAANSVGWIHKGLLPSSAEAWICQGCGAYSYEGLDDDTPAVDFGHVQRCFVPGLKVILDAAKQR